MSNTSSNKTSKTNKQTVKVIVGEIGRDTKTGILGRGYSYDNGATFHVTDTMFGRLYDKDDGERMWPNMAHKVADEIKSATADLPNVRKQANEAVKFAESAVAASKVNSDAIVAQSKAISEAKSAMDSATAEIQQTAANAASDAAKIRADVAQVQNEVDTAKAANSASVEALKSDIGAAKQDLADVHDSLDKAQSAIEQNQKLINDNVAKITSDVSATKQDLANVHDSLTKAQAAAEQNQKAIDQSIAQINSDVDGTKQDLAGVRKDLTKAQADITANQKSINDNVAQINADITQDRKDIASVQQANADTAKQLDTYAKQAQEQGKTIKAVQDTQDGFSTTLASVQGNVTQITDTVNGLSASLKDAQGNVASVKAQADQLSATLTDHGKAIATLTASAKELSSTLEDADGRLSKVEQTAQTNSSTLSDVQGDLSQVKQNATKLVSTLKDAQGNISTLQQKADSVSTQLASAQGDIATLQTGVDSFKATLTSHDKSIHTLQADSKSLKDSMADAQGDISTLSKTATSLDSEMKDHAGRLSKVEQSAATQATTLSDLQGNLTQVKQQADGLVTTLKDAQGSITQIKQQADGTLEQLKSAQGDIASLQTDVTGIKATLVSHEGDIHTLQLDSKTLKDDMTDAKGNISSLQKSSTKLDSEMSSQDGRISKVEQTAKEHTSTISDLGKKVDSNGGGVNLLTNSQGPFRPTQKISSATVSDNYDVYNSDVYMVQGQTYTVSGQTNGTWSGTHDTEHVSDNCVLWLTDNSNVSQIISADTMPHTFTWPYPTKSYHLRVNAYHHGADNPIYAEKVKIERGSVATPYSPAPEDLATVTQVKQTADGIENTLKSAQGDIDQIKQTAKGTSEQLSNVQGDVTNIQKDVNGLKQTTADNAGNIHTLQSDSKALQDDMKDAKGNISSLQKTATSLVSEFRDHDGRLSKVEQTATEHTSELADTKGNIDKVTQKANTLQLLLSDAQKNIQNIQLDAKGLHDTLTGQSNQLASLNVTLNNLDSKYSGITGDLQSKQTALSTEQQQTKDLLLRKADKSEVDNVKGTVSQVSAEQKIMADQINQKVSSTEYQTLKDKVDGMKIGGRNLLLNSAGPFQPVFDGRIDNNQYYNNSTVNLVNGRQYTVSGQTNGVFSDDHQPEVESDKCILWLANTSQTIHQIVSDNNTANGTTFIWNRPTGTYILRVNTYHPTSTNKIKAWNIKIESGNKKTDWSPAPEDTITAIQKNSTAIDENSKLISLMAKQTDVDNIKGTAQQLSARLDVMAGEVKSKVDETRVNNIVDGKGYATTSTVQSLVDQKAGTLNESITNLTNKLVNNNGGGVNLVSGTIEDIVVDDTANTGTQGWRFNTIPINADLKVGDKITVSVENVTTTGRGDLSKWGATLASTDISEMRADNYEVNAGKNAQVTITVNSISDPNKQTALLIYSGRVSDTEGKKAVFHHLKVERGEIATPYSQAPSDNATVTQLQSVTASIDGLQSRVTNYQNDTSSKYTQLSDLMQSKVNQGDLNSVRTQLAGDINERVQKGELLSQINLTAGNTLIQSNKLYLDASSVVITGTAFIPSAAITNLSADKVTSGTLNTNNVNLGDGRSRIRADHDYLYIQPTGSAASNTGIRMSYTGLDFLTNVIPNGYNASIPYFSVGYDGAANGLLRISAFDHLNPGGTTATQNWFTMYDAISLNNKEVNIAANNKPRIRVTDGGVNVRPTLFFDNENYSGTWAGFTRANNSDTVEFNTGNNDGENFHVNSGARFMKYVYFNDYCRAQGWLTYSTLSKKTNIRKLDTSLALEKIRQDEQYLYEYKRNVAKGIYDPQASFIIDDVNDVSHYSVPREFIDQSGKYREPNVELAYLIAAFQEIDKQVQLQKEEIRELKEKLQHE